MISNNLYIFLGILSLFSVVVGERVTRNAQYKNADELDRNLIEQTGCKYLYLEPNQTVLFTKSDVQHTVMASMLPEQLLRQQFREPLENGFETHFAVRADNEVHVDMYSGARYGTIDWADYQVGFGSVNNAKSFLRYTAADYPDSYNNEGLFHDTPTPKILSPDDYAKFYVKIDTEFKYGRQCEGKPIYAKKDFAKAPLEVIKFGFYAKGENGAKILYDCPADFAGCPCDWFVKFDQHD